MRSIATPPTLRRHPHPPLQRDPPAFSGEGLRLSEEADSEGISAAAALRSPLAVRGVDTGVEMSASLDSGNLMSGGGAQPFVAELSGERSSGEIIAGLLSVFFFSFTLILLGILSFRQRLNSIQILWWGHCFVGFFHCEKKLQVLLYS